MAELASISAPQQQAKDTASKELLPQIKDKDVNKDDLRHFPIQTKLTVGAPDDPYEKEADSVADKVMRLPEQNFVQRKCAHCEEEEKKQIHRKPISENITPAIQTKRETAAPVSNSISNKINSSHGQGGSMDNITQSFMQNRFGTDFNHVKIHTNSEAIQMSRELNAKAFTAGNDIYFNEGQYQPNSCSGKQLLAHELTHVLQQSPITASDSLIQRKEVEVPEMDPAPEWEPKKDREYQWKNQGLRDIIYPEREQSLRAFLEIVKELELSGNLEPALGLTDKAAIKKEQAAYIELLKGMNHDALVVETMAVFKKFKDTTFFPDWVRYTVIHYSGMRYESAHSTWVAPQGLLVILKEREKIEADKQHKDFMTAKGKEEHDADPGLKGIKDWKQRKGYLNTLKATEKSTIEKRLSVPDKGIYKDIVEKEEIWYKLTLELSGMGNDAQKAAEKLKEIQTIDKEIDDLDLTLSEKGKKLVIDSREKRRQVYMRIHLELAKERLKGLSEEEAIFLLSEMHNAGQIPEPVWKEIVSFTQLRLEVNDASELINKNDRMLKGIKESDKISKDQLDVWKVLLKMWYESSGGTRWRENHRLTLSPSIVTSLVCDQLGTNAQNIRGVTAPGGLRGNAKAFFDAAKKSGSTFTPVKWDGKTACPPAPATSFFKIPQQIEDFPCGAAIFWAGWSDLNVSTDYMKLYEKEEKPLLNSIKKLETEKEKIKTEKEKLLKDKKDIEVRKKKIDDLKTRTAKDNNDLKKIESDLKKIDKSFADKDKRFKEIEKQLPPWIEKKKALKKKIDAMEVFLPEKDKTPDFSNTFVPFDSADLEMKENNKTITDGMKDGEWTYSVNDKRLVAGHPMDKAKKPIPVKTIMRVKPNPFHCPDGEKSCPLNFTENKDKKLIKQWMIWKHQATVMFVMSNTNEIITYDTSGTFNRTEIKGMSAQRRSLNSLINPDKGHRIYVGYSPNSKPVKDPTDYLDEKKILQGIQQPTQAPVTQPSPQPTPSSGQTPLVQPKLQIGGSNDIYERQADDIAQKVMSMPFVQRKCADCEKDEKLVQKTPNTHITSFIQTKCEECNDEENEMNFMSDPVTTFSQSQNKGPLVSAPLSESIEGSLGRGFYMDASTQSFMEDRFGNDFSDVNIHTDAEASDMNRELGAKAFTVGNNIYFNEGQYQPHTEKGKQLLAHELTHTIQQNAVLKLIQKKDGEKSPDRKIKSLLLLQIKEEKVIHMRFNVLFTDNSTSAFEIEWDLQEGEELDIGKQYQIQSNGLFYEINSKQDSRRFSLTLNVTDKFGKKFYSSDLDNAGTADPDAKNLIDDMRILNRDLAKGPFAMDADIMDMSDADKSGKAQKGFPSKPVKEKPVLNFSLPSWFAELKKKIEEKIEKDKEANKDNPYFPDKMYFYGSDKVQLKKGKDAWTIQVEKSDREAYYTVLKKQWDDAEDKDAFTGQTVTIFYEKVQLTLTRPAEDSKEIDEIDGAGETNKFKDSGDKLKANPFSGLKKEEQEKLKELIKQLAGDTKPDDKTPPPKIQLSSNDIKALLQLADDPNRDKIIAYLKAKTGNGVSSTKTLEELIAIAKLREAYGRFDLKPTGGSERQEPIVSRPVQGVIIQHDPLIVAHKPISVGFEVHNDVDALRVPHIAIWWLAYADSNKNDANSPALKEKNLHDEVNYIPIDDEGVFNRKHGKFEFPFEGVYIIEAIVDHNFFLPNHFRTSVKVLDEQKVLKEKEEKAYKGFLKEGTTTKEDFGELSYGEGTVTRGKLDEKFQGATAEEQLKVIDQEITRIKGIIEEYKKKDKEGAPMVEWGEKYLAKLQSNRDNIAKTNEDKTQNLIASRGTYVSRTEGVKTADLKLSCFIKKDTKIIPPSGEFDEGGEEGGYRITLYDYTQLYENENYKFDVFATTSEGAMKQAFSLLSEAYPEGHISLAFQKWDDTANKKTGDYIKYTRVTDTIGKKIKKVAFSTPVNIAVNVVAAVLSVFPPTTGIGIAIGILYNGAQTISELEEQADKGTLTGKKVLIGCGSMLLDILPILGSAGKAAKIVRVGTKAYYVVEGIQLTGQALLVYETGMEQVEKLRTDYFVKIAELDDEIAELQRTNPSDPAIDKLISDRQKLMDDGKNATVKVLGEMAAQQVAFTVGGKLLHGIHEHYSAKSKLEARGKIVDSLTGVEKLNEGERLALADKIYDNDIPIKASKETRWKKEGDGWVLEIADNATHAEIDALLDKNPNAKTTAEPGAAKPSSGEPDTSVTERKQVEKDAKAVSNSPIDAESKTPVTATNEVHEHLIHEDGTITRCSDRCAKLLDNTTDRAKEIQKLFGKEHGNTKKAKELKEKAKQLEKETKDASKIKDKTERKTKEDEILSKAKQLELDLAVLEKAMVSEIDSRISKSMDDIATFLDKYPEYKGEFERRIKNRNERKKEIASKLNDPDLTIKGEALDELRHEAELAKELLRDMQKHADNLTKPDISKRYNYYETSNKQGDHVKVAEGELGVPGEVMKHRSQTEQGKVSAGTGDDAGHLIANVFGAEGGGRNLGKQNWIANEFGTWRQLEIMWAEKLVNGTKVSVKIREVARAKGERPYMREATWTEIDPSGNVTNHSLTFGNFESVKSRAATGAAPTAGVPEGEATVFIWNKERAKRGLDPVYSKSELQNALEYLHGQGKAENDVFTAANDNAEL